jgi:hypothetical protein
VLHPSAFPFNDSKVTDSPFRPPEPDFLALHFVISEQKASSHTLQVIRLLTSPQLGLNTSPKIAVDPGLFERLPTLTVI